MTKIQIDSQIASQIQSVTGRIELVDSDGQTVGIVRRPPSQEEIDRAKSRLRCNDSTLSWAELMAKVKEEIGQ